MKIEKPRSSFTQLIPWFLTFFLVLGFLPMITLAPSTDWAKFFDSRSLTNGLYYFVVSIVFVIYIAIVWLHEKMDPPTRYIIMFGVMLLYAFSLLFIHDQTVSYLNVEGAQSTYHLLTEMVVVYTAEVLYDLIFAFGFIFLWPWVKKTPRFQSVLPLVVVAIAFVSVIIGYALGPSSTETAYPNYASFYQNDVVFSEVVFAGIFASAVLAYHYRGSFRYVFLVLLVFFFVSEGVMALSLAFWASAFSLVIFAITLLGSSVNYPAKRRLIRWGIGVFLVVVLVLFILTLTPGTSTALKPYLSSQISTRISEDLDIWYHYFSLETGWRIILGDGLMGFYRYSLSISSTGTMISLNNGFMEAYDSGGVVYLLFYLLLIFVGFYGFKRSEKRNPIFFGLVLGFVLAFLFLSALTSERLLFSSHYPSFVASYLFSCYTAEGREEA